MPEVRYDMASFNYSDFLNLIKINKTSANQTNETYVPPETASATPVFAPSSIPLLGSNFNTPPVIPASNALSSTALNVLDQQLKQGVNNYTGTSVLTEVPTSAGAEVVQSPYNPAYKGQTLPRVGLTLLNGAPAITTNVFNTGANPVITGIPQTPSTSPLPVLFTVSNTGTPVESGGSVVSTANGITYTPPAPNPVSLVSNGLSTLGNDLGSVGSDISSGISTIGSDLSKFGNSLLSGLETAGVYVAIGIGAILAIYLWIRLRA